nr:hypothetical protein [Pseudomonas luteola]
MLKDLYIHSADQAVKTNNFINLCDKYFQQSVTLERRTPDGYKLVYAKARAHICDVKNVFAVIAYLKRKLVILHHKKGFKFSKYFQVLDSIRESARSELSSESSEPYETDWEALIEVIIKNRSEIFYFDNENSSLMETELHNFAHSYLRLSNFGVKFVDKDHTIHISECSYDLIDRMIDSLCQAYGGENLTRTLAKRLGGTYNSATGRFMEYRHLSSGTTTVHSAIPFGYLIAIASKYIGARGNGEDVHYENLLRLVTDLIVVYEIQPYNQYEAMFVEGDVLIKFIKENILYDGFVGIAQTKASYANALITFLKGKFSDSEFKCKEIKIKDLTRIAAALISLAHTKKFINLRLKDIANKAGLAEFKVATVMDQLLSVPSGAVNSELRFPPSSLEVDHYFKPSVKNGKDYLVFPKSIASLGSLNTVLNAIASPDGKWSNPRDSKLGYAIEDFLREAFTHKGIKFINGERKGGAPDLEADLICETDDEIYIFEMKKKGLTREAQAGDESKILADLADSVLATHVQAMRIESALKSNDSLTFISHNTQKTLCLNNRRVQRISVSLHDFGALQDKTILQRLLIIAATSQASHSDSEQDKRLRKWRNYSAELRQLAIANGEMSNSGSMPFHNSLFMSIPQIIMVLENSKDAVDFFKHIKSFIYMTTGTRNTYSEFSNRLAFLDQCKAEGITV